jgi:ABC-type polysaccharide/polyol phosphate transport system ATPase subunit
MDALTLEKVSKQYERPTRPAGKRLSRWLQTLISFRHTEPFWALNDVSFCVGKGSMFGIVGDNGSGKSTLLKIIGGITEPTTGTVQVNGKVAALLELGAGFHPDLTAMENIFLNSALLGMSKELTLERLPSIISFSGLERFLYTPLKYFSSGMQTRLGFSIAVNVDPEILLVDEILAVGDAEFQMKSFNKIQEFRERGKTVLLVTHQIDTARDICDEMLWLDRGTVRALGAPADVFLQYRRVLYAKSYPDRVVQWAEKPEQAPIPQEPLVQAKARVIKRVVFRDGEGRERTLFYTGEPASIEIEFSCPSELERPLFELVIIRDDGVLVYDVSSRQAGLELGRAARSGILRIFFNPLRLMKGNYVASVRVVDEHAPEQVYDLRAQQDRFEVRTENFPYYGFVAELPCRWELLH